MKKDNGMNISRNTSALEGKVMRYQYYESVLVEVQPSGDNIQTPNSEVPPGIWAPTKELGLEVRFGHLAFTWTAIVGGEFGITRTQPCVQVEIAPDIYQMTWMEPNHDVGTMVINLKKKRVSTSLRHDLPGSGPVVKLELLGARILEFGTASEMGYSLTDLDRYDETPPKEQEASGSPLEKDSDLEKSL